MELLKETITKSNHTTEKLKLIAEQLTELSEIMEEANREGEDESN